MELKENLKRRRIAAGLTQGELAAALQVKQAAVSLWETGRNEPDLKTLVKLATLYKCSLDDLAGFCAAAPAEAAAIAQKISGLETRDRETIEIMVDSLLKRQSGELEAIS